MLETPFESRIHKKNRHLDWNAVEWRDLSRDRFNSAEPTGSRLHCTPPEMTDLIEINHQNAQRC